MKNLKCFSQKGRFFSLYVESFVSSKRKKHFKSGLFSFLELGKLLGKFHFQKYKKVPLIRKFCYAKVLNMPFLKYKKVPFPEI